MIAEAESHHNFRYPMFKILQNLMNGALANCSQILLLRHKIGLQQSKPLHLRKERDFQINI